jgi:hypothetical protein
MTRKLYPTFNNPDLWRNNFGFSFISQSGWQKLRKRILERDKFTCVFCGFKAEKFMIVHHIDDNPNNNRFYNLETICPMCNLILHVGIGTVLDEVVDLYRKSSSSQEEIIRLTRRMRVLGKTDSQIIKALGLKEKVEFRQNIHYLKKLYGFISSRKPSSDMTKNGFSYVYRKEKERISDTKIQKSLNSFI